MIFLELKIVNLITKSAHGSLISQDRPVQPGLHVHEYVLPLDAGTQVPKN